jgi:hypothetical protein
VHLRLLRLTSLRLAVAVLPLVVATSGCATIIASRTDPYMIYSTPPGATVAVNGVPIGVTPVTVMVDKTKQAPPVTLSLPGYPPQSCWPRLSPATGYIVADTLLCLFVPPLLGCIAFVDAAGAWNELEVNNCNVYFAPQPGSGYEAPPPPPGYPPGPGSDAPPPPPAPL